MICSRHHITCDTLRPTLDVMLMERRANTHVPQDVWMGWLMDRVRNDAPWNETVREILLADGDDPANRAPARFYLDRAGEPNLIARDIGRIFFGMDLQCAQCHDSPLVSDYLQADYQSLLAFVSPGVAVKKMHGDKDVTVYAERAGTDLAFESVFNQGVAHRSGPALPGRALIREPFHYPGEEYTVAPADKVRSIPRFSRRQQLATLATDGHNKAFNLNAANRLWAVMFGRGLIDPPDMIHMDNSSPGYPLLVKLADALVDGGFRIRPLLRQLALSRTYQRPFDLVLDSEVPGRATLAGTAPAQQSSSADAASAAYATAYDAFDNLETAYVPLYTAFESARGRYSEARTKRDAAQQELDAAALALQDAAQVEGRARRRCSCPGSCAGRVAEFR
jgi:hypothetical protein